MPSQGQEQQAASLQRKVDIGAKSLDRDLGDVHTWPHSHYLMRQCDGVGGWVRLNYRLCRCECEMRWCEINDLMKEKTGTSILFILHGPLGSPGPLRSPDPFAPLTPLLS